MNSDSYFDILVEDSVDERIPRQIRVSHIPPLGSYVNELEEVRIPGSDAVRACYLAYKVTRINYYAVQRGIHKVYEPILRLELDE